VINDKGNEEDRFEDLRLAFGYFDKYPWEESELKKLLDIYGANNPFNG
jgi:hypothetical protein